MLSVIGKDEMASQAKASKVYANVQANLVADPVLMREYLIDSAGLVQVSEGDAYIKRLEDALVVGSGLGIAKQNAGGDERLQLTLGSHVHVIGDVTGLQTALDGKALLSHTHVIGDVTNLQSTLNGKASLVHTHVAADITGGTLAHERGGLEADVSAYNGLLKVSGGTTSVAIAGTDYASASHTHSATDVTSGTFDNARINWASPNAIGGTTANTGTFSEARVTGSVGTERGVTLRTLTSNRWRMIVTSSTESGGNTGSNFSIVRHNDDGTTIGNALVITRTTGAITTPAVYSTTVTSSPRAVYADSTGLLGYLVSLGRYKTSVVPLSEREGTVDMIRALAPSAYYYVDDLTGQVQFGFIAEQVEAVSPHLCYYDHVVDADGNETGLNLAGVNYQSLHALSIAGVQHALDRCDKIEATISTLLARIEVLEGLLA